jgi:hypothetical protein
MATRDKDVINKGSITYVQQSFNKTPICGNNERQGLLRMRWQSILYGAIRISFEVENHESESIGFDRIRCDINSHNRLLTRWRQILVSRFHRL